MPQIIDWDSAIDYAAIVPIAKIKRGPKTITLADVPESIRRLVLLAVETDTRMSIPLADTATRVTFCKLARAYGAMCEPIYSVKAEIVGDTVELQAKVYVPRKNKPTAVAATVAEIAAANE